MLQQPVKQSTLGSINPETLAAINQATPLQDSMPIFGGVTEAREQRPKRERKPKARAKTYKRISHKERAEARERFFAGMRLPAWLKEADKQRLSAARYKESTQYNVAGPQVIRRLVSLFNDANFRAGGDELEQQQLFVLGLEYVLNCVDEMPTGGFKTIEELRAHLFREKA